MEIKRPRSAVLKQAYRNPALARTVPSPMVCAPSILFTTAARNASAVMEGGLHPHTGSPGSFLLFVGFYAYLYFVHHRII